MTARLTQTLRDAAEIAPPVLSADRLWRRGRLVRRRRRNAAVLACLLLATAMAWAPVRPPSAPEVSGTDLAVLPTSVAEPYLWQRTLAGDPNGPVKLTFMTGRSLNFENALVLIGRDDTYRLDYLPPGEEGGALSPDGRWLLDENLRDLTTGETRKLDRPLSGHGHLPAVWARDSRTALGVIGESYGSDPHGRPIGGLADEIVLVDVASGTTRKIETVANAAAPWQAAFSPDGSKLALHTFYPDNDSVLMIIDTRTAKPVHTVTLTEQQRLAGPAAWTPDGSQILFIAGDTCTWAKYCANQTWHLQRIDLATGTIVDETMRRRPGDPTVIAWRDGVPIVQLADDDSYSCDNVALTDTGTRPLPLTVAGYGCAHYARGLLEEGTFGGPGITPSWWQAQWWAYVLVAGLLAGLALVVRRIRRRIRASRTRQTR